MHSTDDGCTGYPGHVSSLSSGSLLEDPEASKAHPFPIVKWLVPPHPPCTCDVSVQTNQVVKEVWEEETVTKHYRARWWCDQGLPHCHLGTFLCFSCKAQEGGEFNLLDSDGLG